MSKYMDRSHSGTQTTIPSSKYDNLHTISLIAVTQGLKLLERAAGPTRRRWPLLLLSLLLHSQLPPIDRHLQTWEHETP